MRITKRLVGLGFLLSLTASIAYSQNANSGEIKGAVTDPNGAVIVEATVTIANVRTGVKTTLTTNTSGLYDAPSVPAGDYTVTFAKSGFRDFVRQGIVLQVGTITVDATLEVGVPAEQVVVTGDAPLLETQTSEQHVTFDTKAVLDAPIVGGIWYNELTAVLPGVAGGAGASGEGIAVNGTRAFDANWLLEGASATDPRDNNPSDNFPPVDSISEVTIKTSNFSAQYGNGVISLNVGIKSGTNGWHGSGYEFVQNDSFDSLNFFNTSHLKTPKRWNEYGGSVGGPIKKNKLFFFFNFQRNQNLFSSLQFATVPTQAMRNGDFSDPAFRATLFDRNSCSGSCARSPLNGGSNKLLPSQIDPVAAAIQNLLPLPNLPGLSNNYQAVISTPTTSKWYVGKVDYQISQSQRLSGSIVTYPIALTFNASAFCDLGFDCTRSNPVNRNTNIQITHTWTLSPTIVNEARISQMSEHDGYVPGTFGKGLPQKIGLQPKYGSNAPADIFPNITVNAGAGVAGIGLGGGVHADLLEHVYTASDVVTLVRGKHSVKIGGEFDKNYQNYTNWGDVSSGNFTFSGVGTSSGTATDPRVGAAGPGIPYADFLLGNVEAWFVFNSQATSAHMSNLGFFVQDDYKVSPKLTLNLGLRYQHQSGWGVRDNLFGVFDPTLPNPGPFIPANTLGALLYGGKNGRDTIEDAVNEFAPRLGFAWSPWKKWSFRASYGIFDSPRDAEAYTDGVLGLGLNPQGGMGFSNSIVFQLKDGPPANSVTFPTLATLSPALLNFKDVHTYNSKLPIQHSQEIYLDVQRELGSNFLLDAAYVNTKGRNLNFSRDTNQVPENRLGTGQRPFVQYATIKDHRFDGYSNYNALQLRAVKRFSKGLSLQVNYAWSRFLDTGTGSGHTDNVDIWQRANDVSANYGLSTLDATHNFTGVVSYEIPVGEGRMYPVHGLLNQVIGGWRISSIFSARSGVPFTPTTGNDNSGALSGSCFCGFAQFPNRLGNGNLSNPTIDRWFDPTAFAVPAANTFGNSGRNILRGPHYVDVDLSLGKSFHIWERVGLEIRADAFNAFNHPNFVLPNSNINSPDAGKINSTTSFGAADRVIQLGARFTF